MDSFYEKPVLDSLHRSGIVSVLQYFILHDIFTNRFNATEVQPYIDPENDETTRMYIALSNIIASNEEKLDVVDWINELEKLFPNLDDDPSAWFNALVDKVGFGPMCFLGEVSDTNVFSIKIETSISREVTNVFQNRMNGRYERASHLVLYKDSSEQFVPYPKTIHIEGRNPLTYKLEGYINQDIAKNSKLYIHYNGTYAKFGRNRFRITDNSFFQDKVPNWRVLFYELAPPEEIDENDNENIKIKYFEEVSQDTKQIEIAGSKSLKHVFRVVPGAVNELLDQEAYPAEEFPDLNTFIENILKIGKTEKLGRKENGELNYDDLYEKVTGKQRASVEEVKRLYDIFQSMYDRNIFELNAMIEEFNKEINDDSKKVTLEEVKEANRRGPRKKGEQTAASRQKQEINENLSTFDWVQKAEYLNSIELIEIILAKQSAALPKKQNRAQAKAHLYDINSLVDLDDGTIIPLEVHANSEEEYSSSSEYEDEDNTDSGDGENNEEKSKAEVEVIEKVANEESTIIPSSAIQSETDIGNEISDSENVSVEKQSVDDGKQRSQSSIKTTAAGSQIQSDSSPKKQSNSSQDLAKTENKTKWIVTLKDTFFRAYSDAAEKKITASLNDWLENTAKTLGIPDKDANGEAIRLPKINTLMKWRRSKFPKEIADNKNKNSDDSDDDTKISHNTVLTPDTINCILIVSLYFPYSTTKQKVDYVRTKGPNEAKNISQRSVLRCLTLLGFRKKVLRGYAYQRNSSAAIVARAIWAKKMLSLAGLADVLMCFIDEASIDTSQRNKFAMCCKGCNTYAYKKMKGVHISILACVIPGFGASFKLAIGSIKHKEYNEFLEQNAVVIRTIIGCETTKLFFIMDNAQIHKVKCERPSFNTIFTIPYSPQTNGPAENFFGSVKGFITPNIDSMPKEQDMILNWVESQVVDFIQKKFDVAESTKYFDHVVAVWKNCEQLMPLSEKITRTVEEKGTHFNLRIIKTRRENNE